MAERDWHEIITALERKADDPSVKGTPEEKALREKITGLREKYGIPAVHHADIGYAYRFPGIRYDDPRSAYIRRDFITDLINMNSTWWYWYSSRDADLDEEPERDETGWSMIDPDY